MKQRKKPRGRAANARRRVAKLPADGVARLAGGIAHDFNNLLTVMRNCTAFLRQELDEQDPRQQYVDQLVTAAHRMSQVARQLQAFGRGQFMHPEDVRPAEIIRRMSDTLRHVLPETVEFRASVRATSSVVHVDPTQLERAVVGLLMYVAEAVSDGGRIWLSVTDTDVETSSPELPAGRYVEIKLASTAPKMSEAERKQAFQPGFQKKRGATGSDLRLASAYGIVKQAGGHMVADAERGKGMVFRILLPIVEREAREPAPLNLTAERSLHGEEIIMVVEDDPDVRRTVCDSLERYGYTVFEAADGADALRLADLLSTPTDLVLTDVVMPEVGGRELLEVLKYENKLPKVLLMSGYTDEMLEHSMPETRYAFIPKPFTHEELAERVREVLDSPASMA